MCTILKITTTTIGYKIIVKVPLKLDNFRGKTI